MPCGRWAPCIWVLPAVIPCMWKKLFVSRPDRALIRARAAQEALVLALRRAQDKVPAATKPLAAADCRDAAALEALNAAFLAE